MEEKREVTKGNGTATPVPSAPVPAASVESQGPAELDDRTWERVVERAERPVVVMFHSPACTFCHQMEPYFRSFADDYKDSVVFARLNILSNPWTAERYGVRSTPTFKFFCSGKPVREMVGAVFPALLKKMVDEVLVHGDECAKRSTAIDYEITGYG